VRQVTKRLLPVILLFLFGISIGVPALDPAFEPGAQHFDGDADDAGHVGKAFVHWIDPAVTETLTLAPAAPARRQAPSKALRPPQRAREPLGSRAPPA
jgi:hypothetical protein